MFSSALRQSLSTVHTWVGVTFCWFLYMLFVTGSIGFYDTVVDHWMEPEVTTPTVEETSLERSLTTGLNYLEEEVGSGWNWQIYPALRDQSPKLAAVWFPNPKKRYEVHLNVDGDQTGVRETGGGQTLYQAHYGLKYIPIPYNFRIMAVATFLMLMALITGVVIHAAFFRDMFTFRADKKQQSWLDGHLLMAVSSLPFQFMMTLSGLLFVAGVILPFIGALSFGGNQQQMVEKMSPFFNRISAAYITTNQPAGEQAQQYPIYELARTAAEQWGSEDDIRSVEIMYPGDAESRVIVHREYQGVSGFGDVMLFDGVSGELIKTEPAHPDAASGVLATLTGLHQAVFAGPIIRFLYFLSGLAGIVMVGTGAVYWTVKRRNKLREGEPAGFGLRLVEHLNVGAITGVPTGIAAYFIANRLLPIGIENRMQLEVDSWFIVMGIMFIYPLFRPLRAAWSEQLWITSLAFLMVPIINIVTTEVHIFNSVSSGDWKMAAFDIANLVTSVVFAGIALSVHKFWKNDTVTLANKGSDIPLPSSTGVA